MDSNLIKRLQIVQDVCIIVSIATFLMYIRSPWGLVLGFVIGPIVTFFLLDGRSRDVAVPFLVNSFLLGLVSIVIWYSKTSFKGKSILRIIYDSLHLSPVINVFAIFFCLFDIDPIALTADFWRHALAAWFIFDFVRGILRLPGDIQKAKDLCEEFYQSLEDEKTELDKAATMVDGIDEGIRDLLNERILLIDDILISRMSGTVTIGRDITKKIDEMTSDRDSFIRSLGLLYSVNHSRAIRQLKEYGLTEKEIGLCCLYYLGYSGKEVKEIAGSSMVYHMNSAIRQKIGLKANDMNLTTFMKQLFSK